jgi:hypothetical protein
MVKSAKGLGSEEDYAGEDLSSERAPHKNKTVTVNE